MTVSSPSRRPRRRAPATTRVDGSRLSAATPRLELGYEVVEYPHIHRRHVVEPATTRVKVIDVRIAPGLESAT